MVGGVTWQCCELVVSRLPKKKKQKKKNIPMAQVTLMHLLGPFFIIVGD